MVLILQKKESEAIEVLKSIRNSDYDIDRELDDIKLQVEGLKHGSLYFASSLKRRGTKRALLTMIILCFVQQSTFISAYMFWASESGMIIALEHNFFWFAVMVQILVQMIGVFSSLITIDSSGRRTLLLISAALVMISTMGLAIRILYYDDQWLQNINQVDIIFTTSATIMHSVGLTTIPWLLTTEMYTPDIKWLGGVISAVFAWSRRLAVSEFLYFYDKEMVFRVNVVLASISAAIGILVAFFLVIETRNRKMGEIHEILNGGRIEK
ncbi:unnamed protein product [Hermetia illucens]|uniref:Sugar transporter n=2 Tax=Hermetia illucens TaxID=343691 RepID=A0A7R8UIB4_HERIL|nr:unnamed protein product [Hermetia illucens]